MGRRELWLELASPFAACLVAVAAALLAMPAVLSLLSAIWFAPAVLRRLGVWSRLDEREGRRTFAAQHSALSVLLVLATLLPLLSSLGGRSVLDEIRTQGLDLGFLLVAIVFLRAAVFAIGTLPRHTAAHHAGAFATFVGAILIAGNAWMFPEKLPLWFVASPLICLLPHAVAMLSPRIAGVLWLGGAAVTVGCTLALTGSIAAVEQVCVLALMAVPWTIAALWSALDNPVATYKTTAAS